MIKFLARDDETGRIGTYETVFVIPNLNKEDKRVPISSVVLSSQRVDLKEALFDAEKRSSREKESAVNPLVENGTKLIPSVTRSVSLARCSCISRPTSNHWTLARPVTNLSSPLSASILQAPSFSRHRLPRLFPAPPLGSEY